MRLLTLVRGGILLGAAATVLWLERRRRARPYVEPPVTHVTRNLAFAGLAAATVQILEAPVVMPVARLVERRRWGLLQRIGGPSWLRAIAGMLLLDYTLYLWHRLAHRAPWLWRFHLVHHVDLDLDATTGLRFHAGELAASVPWRAAQVVAIGVTPGTLMLWQTLTLACVLFHHSNARLGARAERILSWILATPQMHAIHHSIEPVQLHSNFSSGLAIWDRLHGTARFDARPQEVTVGVLGYLAKPTSFTGALRLPFETGSDRPPRPPQEDAHA